MHRTHHRAPVKRDSWYIGWKEKLGASGGVKELEHRELGRGKKNSARVNERESTGEKFTSSSFFFFLNDQRISDR